MGGQHRPAPRASRRSFLLFLGATAVAGAGVLVDRMLGSGTKEAPAAASARPTRTRSLSPAPTRIPPSPTPTRTRGHLLIHAGGDTSLDPGYISTFRSDGYEFAWTGLNGLFQRDDLSLVNCECPVSTLGSKYPGKEFNFRGDPAALPAMKAAGVEVANLGNNHAYDYGPVALMDSVRNLRAHDIEPVGAGRDPSAANAPAVFERNGWTIGVIGFDKVVDPFPTAVARLGHPGTADGHDLDAMVAATRAAKKHADLVVVAIHWGVELDTQPRADDVVLAGRLVEAGADMIFGGHSHRLQPMGVYGDRPVFYSLGNFVWPNFSVAGATTAVAEVKVTANGKNRVRGRLIPAFITAPGHPELRGS